MSNNTFLVTKPGATISTTYCLSMSNLKINLPSVEVFDVWSLVSFKYNVTSAPLTVFFPALTYPITSK